MTVRTDRFVPGVLVDTDEAFPVFTVEAMRVALVKQLRVLNVTGDPHTFDMWIGADPVAGAIWRQRTLAGYEAVSLPHEDQWEEGEQVWFLADAPNVFTVRAGGSYLVKYPLVP